MRSPEQIKQDVISLFPKNPQLGDKVKVVPSKYSRMKVKEP